MQWPTLSYVQQKSLRTLREKVYKAPTSRKGKCINLDIQLSAEPFFQSKFWYTKNDKNFLKFSSKYNSAILAFY